MKVLRDFAAVLSIMLFAASAGADTHIVQVKNTDAFEIMGKKTPARVDTLNIWIGGDKVRFSGDEMTSIYRGDLGVMYVMMPLKNLYVEVPMTSEEKDAKEEESQQPFVIATVTPSDETKKIGDWNCRKYNVKLQMKMGMTGLQEMWATEDIDADYGKLSAVSGAMLASFPGYLDMVKEMQKIKGAVVLETATLSVMGAELHSTTEAVLVEQEKAPEGTYEVPAGYEKAELSALSPH